MGDRQEARGEDREDYTRSLTPREADRLPAGPSEHRRAFCRSWPHRGRGRSTRTCGRIATRSLRIEEGRFACFQCIKSAEKRLAIPGTGTARQHKYHEQWNVQRIQDTCQSKQPGWQRPTDCGFRVLGLWPVPETHRQRSHQPSRPECRGSIRLGGPTTGSPMALSEMPQVSGCQ